MLKDEIHKLLCEHGWRLDHKEYPWFDAKNGGIGGGKSSCVEKRREKDAFARQRIQNSINYQLGTPELWNLSHFAVESRIIFFGTPNPTFSEAKQRFFGLFFR